MNTFFVHKICDMYLIAFLKLKVCRKRPADPIRKCEKITLRNIKLGGYLSFEFGWVEKCKNISTSKIFSGGLSWND